LKTPTYIKGLVSPRNGQAGASRKVWSIDLETWRGFFTATNVAGETDIPRDAIGAPLRAARAKDGSIRFNDDGHPIVRVAKPLNDAVKLVRENFTAGLMDYTAAVAKTEGDKFKAEAEACLAAGNPITIKDSLDVAQAIADAMAQAEREAAQANPAIPDAGPERELVAA